MKHLKLYESFEASLDDEQQEDLNEVFFEYVKLENLNAEEARQYLTDGTDHFVDFLNYLQNETTWFDYTQVPAVKTELDHLLDEYDIIENEEIEFDDTKDEDDEDSDLLDPEDEDEY